MGWTTAGRAQKRGARTGRQAKRQRFDVFKLTLAPNSLTVCPMTNTTNMVSRGQVVISSGGAITVAAERLRDGKARPIVRESPMSAPCNTLCQGCGRLGFLAIGDYSRPGWCRCQKARPGPLVVAPGFVIVLRHESEADAAKREEGRLLGNAERAARDNLSFRFVRCGSGWRELRRSSPKRRALETEYRKARRALEAFQATCGHPTRSIHDSAFCDVCHVFVAEVGAGGAA